MNPLRKASIWLILVSVLASCIHAPAKRPILGEGQTPTNFVGVNATFKLLEIAAKMLNQGYDIEII